MPNKMKYDYYSAALEQADRNIPNDLSVLKFLDDGIALGDEKSAFARACCYEDGKFGSKIDKKLANSLFFSLKNSNLPEALFAIAYCYDVGDGIRTNKSLAFDFYLKAAVLGHSEANLQIAEFFREGSTVPRRRLLGQFFRNRSHMPEAVISPKQRMKLRHK
jgi:uncharacterized protein